MEPAANFDPLVRSYRALERIAFGGDLEGARFAFLDRLADCHSILILGEGDGRCLAQLLSVAPNARVHCLDASPAMLDRAETRISGTGTRERVTFECANALDFNFASATYDAVVTLFFLDCFTTEQATGLVAKISLALKPGARWLFADFVLPDSGLARTRARLWLAGLYLFFRWQTGLRTRELPPSEALSEAAGFQRSESKTFQWGLLRSTIFQTKIAEAE